MHTAADWEASNYRKTSNIWWKFLPHTPYCHQCWNAPHSPHCANCLVSISVQQGSVNVNGCIFSTWRNSMTLLCFICTPMSDIILSQNHRIVQVRKDLQDQDQPHPGHVTLTINPLLNHVPEHHIQTVFKHIQWWWLNPRRPLEGLPRPSWYNFKEISLRLVELLTNRIVR